MKVQTTFIVLLILCFCGKPKHDFQFCFTTIVNGTVFIGEAKIGDAKVPCGFLSSTGGPKTNGEYDFANDQDLCGKIASGYEMEIPDSALIAWDNESENNSYKKKISLPPFPRINSNEKYRIGFCIGYQDCVYVRIETIQKQ